MCCVCVCVCVCATNRRIIMFRGQLEIFYTRMARMWLDCTRAVSHLRKNAVEFPLELLAVSHNELSSGSTTHKRGGWTYSAVERDKMSGWRRKGWRKRNIENASIMKDRMLYTKRERECVSVWVCVCMYVLYKCVHFFLNVQDLVEKIFFKERGWGMWRIGCGKTHCTNCSRVTRPGSAPKLQRAGRRRGSSRRSPASVISYREYINR